MNPQILKWIMANFGLPGAIGMALGAWLLSSDLKGNNRNLLDQPPWPLPGGVAVGGVVIGFVIWFVIGLVLGFEGLSVTPAG